MQICRHLQNWLDEPDSAVTADTDSGTLSLRVGDIAAISPLHCPMCGGHPEHINPFESHGLQCTCGVLEALVQDAPDFVEFDPVFNEYHWLFPGGRYRMLYFCPACGNQLPLSRRGDFFSKPTHADRESVKEMIRNIASIDDMYRVLGVPDHVFEHCDGQSCGYRAQFTYSNHWDSLALHVQEQFDGKLNFSWGGKQIKTVS